MGSMYNDYGNHGCGNRDFRLFMDHIANVI